MQQYKIGTIKIKTTTEDRSYKLSEKHFNVFILDNGHGDRISLKSCPEDVILTIKDILSNKHSFVDYIRDESGNLLHTN
jgi:hypothetical protein